MPPAPVLASLVEMVAFFGVALGAAGVVRRRVSWSWSGALVAVVIVHELASTRLLWALPQPEPFAGLQWNWFSKSLATGATVLLILALPRVDFARVGGVWRQRPGSLPTTLGATLGICGVLTLAALRFGGEGASLETILFQATLPGIEEELFYRGLLLVVLNGLFGRSRRVLGADVGTGALLTAVAFALGHLVGWRDGELALSWGSGAYTFVAGLIFVWLRARSGSLLQPILLHNYGNTIFHLL